MKTASRWNHPAHITVGATVYRVTASLEAAPCTVLERSRRCGTVRALIDCDATSPKPWTISADQLYATEAEAWNAAATELERRAANRRRDAAELEGLALTARRTAARLDGTR
jgi:hypothetical protein